jgi:hypothetical protein
VTAPTGSNLVDPADPAFGAICAAAMELIGFGFDPNEPDIAQRAIDVGRERHAAQPLPRVGPLPTRRKAVPSDVVYYMRLGNRIKIGCTSNLTERLSAINPEELMVTEPGHRQLEFERHCQFRELRTHGEWFRFEEPLVSHIAGLRRGVS